MTYGSDTVTPTTLGTGTTEARLNSDSPIQVPDGIIALQAYLHQTNLI